MPNFAIYYNDMAKIMYAKIARNMIWAVLLCLNATAFGQSQTQARKWFTAGEYAKAKPVFARLVKSNPKSGSLNYWYGVCLNETGEHDKALPYLKKAVDSEVENSFRYIGDYYLADGMYQEALDHYDIYLEKVDPTDSMFVIYTRKAEKVKHELKFYKRVQKVTIVDSIVVPKSKFLTAYKMGKECGTIGNAQEMLGGNTAGEGMAYRTEIRDKIYYSDVNENGDMQLYMCYKMLDDWSNPVALTGLPEGDNNYPYLLPDGLTIYFANNSPSGMGGYDLYVTRYSTESDRYLLAENLGMPFNSIANDYMMVIDEVNGLGWFASDRNQKDSMVCVYTFIPSQTKEYYDYASTDWNQLKQAADIRSIAATQTDKNAVRKAQQMLFKLNLNVPQEEEKAFTFVIDDFTDYHAIDDFRSVEARHLFINWEAKQELLQNMGQQLEEKRTRYTQALANERRKMSEELRRMEQQYEALESEVTNMPLAIRNLEIKHIRNK